MRRAQGVIGERQTVGVCLVADHQRNGPFRRAWEIGGDEPLGPILAQAAAFQGARYGLG